MRTITAKMLEEKKACADQVALFRETFPRGCRLTLANVEKAQKVGLDVGWAGYRFVATKLHLDAYRAAIKPHWDACLAAIKPHWDTYRAAIKPHRDAYQAAIRSCRDTCYATTKSHEDAYNAAIRSCRDTCDAAIKPHRDAYNAAVARETLKALLGEDAP